MQVNAHHAHHAHGAHGAAASAAVASSGGASSAQAAAPQPATVVKLSQGAIQAYSAGQAAGEEGGDHK